ncbi:DUF4136 domain-containing protein [Formosa sp. PL04]|uniref:DUF4136 domain-containing protein n=1 Tax=Formosa sp. PL04 TaxID=3081755 RepID=UPI002982071E|nr:DUF4136 domain-containing protein [Formosa sp. PL04]MDW5288919.1 DUF4136 domain-containing protein [Formosa sp. PL04]
MKQLLSATLFPMRKLLFLSSICLLALGCYPDRGGESVDDFDAVYTTYSPEYNFEATYTYSLPDNVVDLDDSEENSPEYIDQEYSNAILGTVRTNLNALGWTEVTTDEAEVVIVAAAFDQTFLSYNPGWWNWYYPWYPGWGWGYPGYYPGYVSGYTSGSILVQMTYPEDTNSDNEVPVIWLGALNGLIQGSEQNIISRITTNINQAFSQPPFNN